MGVGAEVLRAVGAAGSVGVVYGVAWACGARIGWGGILVGDDKAWPWSMIDGGEVELRVARAPPPQLRLRIEGAST